MDRRDDWRITGAGSRRQDGEDPSIFAIALETLAAKAFGDMGTDARIRLICDRTPGHPNCALRRHLDSVPPETRIRDILDRCRVWASHARGHADADDRNIYVAGMVG